MTTADTPVGSKDTAAPAPAPTLGEQLAAKLAAEEAKLQAQAQIVTDLRAKIAAIPAAFHTMTAKTLLQEIEGWFKDL
jgi:hypothetical protein